MEHYLQSAALVLVAVILGLVLNRQGKETALLLSLGVCCMACVTAVEYLQPMIAFLQTLRVTAELDSQMLAIVLKAAGIGLISELARLICADAGEAALGKAIELLSNAVILWLSLPLLQALIDLIGEVLGQL